MARISELPPYATILGHRGVLDYYVWRGIPVARKWPTKKLSTLNPTTREQSTAFGEFMTRLTMTSPAIIAIVQIDTRPTDWTWRDAVARAQYGNLNHTLPPPYPIGRS